MPTFKPLAQPGLFDQHFRLEELTAMGDPLAKIDDVVDWSVFIPVLADMPKPEPEGPGGRPSYDPLMMLKVLIIQNLYNLSDAQAEFQITDRMSFKRFLGLSLADKAPDEKTIWAFRNRIAEHGVAKKFFGAFHAELEAKGMFARKGQMIDATFVEVPRQRNSREDNAAIKDGREPAGWDQKSPQFKAQKDMDARWTKKNGISHYGYKNHVKVDSKSKLIDDFVVSEASLHDSQALEALINVSGHPKCTTNGHFEMAQSAPPLDVNSPAFPHPRGAWVRACPTSSKCPSKPPSDNSPPKGIRAARSRDCWG